MTLLALWLLGACVVALLIHAARVSLPCRLKGHDFLLTKDAREWRWDCARCRAVQPAVEDR